MAKLKLVCMIVLMTVAAGCAPSPANSALINALENIKPALELMDTRYSLYESALDAAGAYLSEPGEQTLLDAKQICAESITEIAALPNARSSLTTEDQSLLVKSGLNIVDYRAPFENEAAFRHYYVRDISLLLYYLDWAPEEDEALQQAVELMKKCKVAFRKTDYLCLNELFCEFRGKEIDSFKDEYLPELTSLCADGLPWDTDAAALKAKAEKLMDDAEADIDAYAEFVGEQYLLLLEIEKNSPDAFTAAVGEFQ